MTHRLQVRLNADYHKRLSALCDVSGVSQTDWVRANIDQEWDAGFAQHMANLSAGTGIDPEEIVKGILMNVSLAQHKGEIVFTFYGFTEYDPTSGRASVADGEGDE